MTDRVLELPTADVNGDPIEYREIGGYPDYRVGSDGSVWSRRRRSAAILSYLGWRRMRLARDAVGRGAGKTYLKVALSGGVDGSPYRGDLYVHHLVLAAFVGPRPVGMEACHQNDEPTDNRLVNLRWDTRKANAEDAVANSLILRGTKQPAAKLNEDKVAEIRRMSRAGHSYQALARRFGVTRMTVTKIVLRITWKHVQP